MDLDEFRVILSDSKVDVWTLIHTAIDVASSDYITEFKDRRGGIVEKLFSVPCPNCNTHFIPNQLTNYNTNTNVERENSKSPLSPDPNHHSNDNNDEKGRGEEDADPYGGLFDDEQTKILEIKEQLEDPEQSEDSVVELLQSLADMDITFQALKETDIGRHVNRLRKHPSNEVRRLVKQLVRKWKETVDKWVKLNQSEQTSPNLIDGDSPQQNLLKNQQNGHPQVPDFGYSPNPQNGSSCSDRNNSDPEQKPKSVPRNEAPPRSLQSAPKPASAPPPSRPPRESTIDMEKLNSARRRLQENYQEAQNAKKQRTVQVMDIHEIPKPKNAFIAKNKGRNHR
ncbi:PREDICTED: probable mediator of RNA polymerase II transcription subunit 26c isoform X2 [Ipomoea nil]|uniref:probable mediator of RNA polymerase II transcription subunit 26c isoform X2 n=1 Tax=Ipomoea nil TaxID=35883 RepID=UPI000901925A|nr:PREDICTED: probable mediator of RNA polymerase II transcription subunit 26c isoform X2 [Ipomoea nil]